MLCIKWHPLQYSDDYVLICNVLVGLWELKIWIVQDLLMKGFEVFIRA